MSANVDKSLDTIIGERKTNRKHLASRRHRKAGTKATIAPVGGVKKPTKQKPVAKAVPTGPSGVPRSNKIVVSGLVSESLPLAPFDVTTLTSFSPSTWIKSKSRYVEREAHHLRFHRHPSLLRFSNPTDRRSFREDEDKMILQSVAIILCWARRSQKWSSSPYSFCSLLRGHDAKLNML
jgi:hypothetical protein